MTVDPPADKLMVLSIHPRHVASILDGNKTVELRRTRPVIEPGQSVAIYATTPSAAIVATCEISWVESGSPSELWRSVGQHSGVQRTEYDTYFSGVSIAHALHLTGVCQLRESVSLTHLRSGGTFSPPQTWHFINRTRLIALLESHPAGPALTSRLTAG